MGAWGSGPFENDDAGDWVYDLEGADDFAPRAATPSTSPGRATSTPSEGAVAVAAAAVRRRRSRIPRAADGLPEDGHRPGSTPMPARSSRATRRLAVAALDRVVGERSELAELWDEAPRRVLAWRANRRSPSDARLRDRTRAPEPRPSQRSFSDTVVTETTSERYARRDGRRGRCWPGRWPTPPPCGTRTSPNPWVGAVARHRRRPAPSTAPPSRPAAATPRSSPSTPPAPPAPTPPAPPSSSPSSRAATPGAPVRAPTPSSPPASAVSSSASPTPTRTSPAAASTRLAGRRDRRRRRVDDAAVAEQLAPYLHHRRTGRPFVVLKLAATLDGRTAAARRLVAVDHRARGPRRRPPPPGRVRRRARRRRHRAGRRSRAHRPRRRRVPTRSGSCSARAPAGARVHPCLELGGDLGDVLDTPRRQGRRCSSSSRAVPPSPAPSTAPGSSTATSSTSRRRCSAATTAARCSPARARRPSPTPGAAASRRRRARATTCGDRPSSATPEGRWLMFTGIVEELGTVAERRDGGPLPLRVLAPCSTTSSAGASIAVNGVLPHRRRLRRRRRAGGRPTPSTRPSPAPTSATCSPATR